MLVATAALSAVAYSHGTSLNPRLAINTHWLARSATVLAAAPADESPLLYQGLSFFSGFADVFTFQQFNGFANKQTGNAIQFAASLGMRRWVDVAFYSSLLLSFVAGVAAYRIVDVKRKKQLTTSTAGAMVASLFILTDVVLNRWHGTRWALLLVAAGSGLINAASSEETGAITSMGKQCHDPQSRSDFALPHALTHQISAVSPELTTFSVARVPHQ